jgi:hypothetical protein
MNSILTFNISVSPEGATISKDIDALATAVGDAPGPPPSEISEAEAAISSGEAPGPPSESEMASTFSADTGQVPGPPSDEEMAGVAAMDLAEAPPPPDEVESGGLAAMEVEEGPPPLEIEVLDEEEDIKGKKTGRTAKPRRKKT